MTIQTLHLRSNVQGKEPVAGTSAGQLPVGSIAVNFNKDEPFLTIQDSAGAIRRIAGIKVGAAAPATPTAGEAWLDTTVATKPVFKVHDGTAWQGAGSGVSTGGTAPASPAEGDLWVDTSVSAKPSLKVYNGTAFVVVTPDASETVKGVVELATTTEATTGSDTTRAVTPAGLKAALAAQAGSSTAPSAPVAGTVWVDSSTTPSVIKVYDGTNWIAQAGATVSGATPPATPATGTLWIDTSASPSVTKIYDGTTWVTATPDGSAAAAIANDAKYATKEEVPWERAGTTVSPKTAGDVVEISAGTAALPGLTPVGDPNTGVFSDGADRIGLATNGVGRLFVDSGGNVGIGGAPSSNILECRGSTNSTIGITKTASHNVTLNAISGGHFTIGLDNSGGGSERLRIAADGKLGVGTSAPGDKLSVSGGNVGIYNTGGSHGNVYFYKDGTAKAWVKYRGDTDQFILGNASDALTIDSSQRIGIGIANPAERLEINGNYRQSNGTQGVQIINAAVPYIQAFTSGGNHPLQINGQDLRFVTGASFAAEGEKARITADGKLLVGTSSSRSVQGDHTPQIQLEGASYQGATISSINNADDSSGAYFFLGKARGGSVGSNTIVNSGDSLGQIRFIGSDGSGDFSNGATIDAIVDGTPGSGDLPTRLVFATTADGASTPTERMTIKSSGIVNIANAPTYADNTAAKAGGLVAGDIYRKADGTLMITF